MRIIASRILGTWELGKLGSLQPNVSTLDLKDEPMSIFDEEFMTESKIPSGNERGNHFRTRGLKFFSQAFVVI